MQTMILVPAYGKKYETADEIFAGWLDGHDFRVYTTSSYCSVRDMARLRMVAEEVILQIPSKKISVYVLTKP